MRFLPLLISFLLSMKAHSQTQFSYPISASETHLYHLKSDSSIHFAKLNEEGLSDYQKIGNWKKDGDLMQLLTDTTEVYSVYQLSNLKYLVPLEVDFEYYKPSILERIQESRDYSMVLSWDEMSDEKRMSLLKDMERTIAFEILMGQGVLIEDN